MASVGPFGGEGGAAWDDGIFTTVRQLIIYVGTVIDSIQIEYDDHGSSKWSEKHGGSGGVKYTVELNYPTEFLISISGYCDEYVNSLTILSNKKQYGPYGTQGGNYFSFPLTSGKITGFHGRSGLYLDSIGAYLEPYPSIFIGPFGGPGGEQYWDDGIHTGIRQLIISSGLQINNIQIEYDLNGQSKWSEKHGLTEGQTTNVVNLDYPDEFVISISGYYGLINGLLVVRSLTIQSNRQQHGPYGSEVGNQFSTSSTSGKIVGFQGRSGYYLDSIGAYFRPFSHPCQSQSISIGPFGGTGGISCDNGIHTTVRKLIIFSGSFIHAIQFEYDNYGQSELSDKYGTQPSQNEDTVELDYPGEFLISISGYYAPESTTGYRYTVVQSLTIQSNRKTYGPFGQENGIPFRFPTAGGKIIGFYGKASQYLDAIGAYVEPILDPCQSISVGPFGGDGGIQWDDGTYTTIWQLIIFSSSYINSIQIEYDNKGQSKWSEMHGQSGDGTRNEVKLDFPGEFLLSISGHYDLVSESVLVRSLTIESNKRTFGPFGVETGNNFKFPSTSGKIIGFHGSSEDSLHSIGAYFEPFPSP